MKRLSPHTCFQILVLGVLLAAMAWTWQSGRSMEARLESLSRMVGETSTRLTVVNTLLRECGVHSTIPTAVDSVGVVFVCSRVGLRGVLDTLNGLR